ncbi:MAG: peptidylprolyl isomerase [Spirochaetes bacterium]|nr:peptidylprolyl isomerase [Spirochaetota bacterium]
MKRNVVTLVLLFVAICILSQEKPAIAVLDFPASGISEREMKSIISLLSNTLVKTGKYVVIDIASREAITKEIEFSMNDLADQTFQIKIGRQLSAQLMVLGSIGKLGSRLVLTARVLETLTSRTVSAADGSYRDLDELVKDIDRIGLELARASDAADSSQLPTEVEEGALPKSPPTTETAVALPAQTITTSKQVATVKLIRMENITVSQLKPQVDALEKTYSKTTTAEDRLKVLDGLINRSLLEQAAERDRIFVSDSELKAKINEYKKVAAQQRGLARELTDAELRTLINSSGLTWDAFTRQLQYGILVSSYARAKRKADIEAVKSPTDQECRNYYDANTKSFFVDDYIHTRQIYLDTRAMATKGDRDKAARRAEDILRELKAGASFADLAAKYSEDTSTKFKGGDMGWLPRDNTTLLQTLGKTFWDALFRLKPGEVSSVLTSNIGLHIVECDEVIAAHLVGFNDKVPPLYQNTVKEFIRANLLAARQQEALYRALDDILKDLRKQAEVRIFESSLAW